LRHGHLINAFNVPTGLSLKQVGARQSQHARKSSPTEEGKPPRNEKDEAEEGISEETEARAWYYIKIDQHAPRGKIGGLLASGRSPFLPSLILNLSTFGINMSGTNIFAGAHDFVANNSTFIAAKTVGETFTKHIYQAS